MTPQSGEVKPTAVPGITHRITGSGLSQTSFSHGQHDLRHREHLREIASGVESDLYVKVAQLPGRSTLRIAGRNYSVDEGDYQTPTLDYVWRNSLRFGWANGQSVPVSIYDR